MSRQDAAETEPASVGAETYVSASRRIDVSPLAAAGAVPDRRRFCWLHPEEPDLLAVGATAAVTVDSPDRFETADDRLTELFGAVDGPDAPEIAAPRAVGGFAFFDGNTVPADTQSHWRDFDDGTFVLPRAQIVAGDDATWLTVTVPEDEHSELSSQLDGWADRLTDAGTHDGTEPEATAFHWSLSREEWERTVDDVIGRIESDGLDKVVLAQELTVDLDAPVPVAPVLSRLRETYPNCTTFCFSPTPGRTFFGATPETLVALADGHVQTEALAGTTDRGETAAEDTDLADAMLGDEKYQVENRIVADTIADALRPVADDVTVAEPSIKRITNLQHLHRPITATVPSETSVLSLAERLHPTPAVGGSPRRAASDVIRDVEPFDRGWYASPVGWVDGDGDGTFVVGIRAGLTWDERLALYGGAGIVTGSDPTTEYGEVRSRFEPILDALEVELP
ncbi:MULTISPECIES: isochorismate synthase [Halomicrobium]|uniref:isochorismate synthase n=2 Tax=Halomicrobium mukohataei TaxID=57705 RepID=C7NVS7_HALMD|nr:MULTISPECIES: isochorismate synthase [Halomicrobium]ACV46192.1 isochorismate synthase [Halomicrobium mukohataei DSM 12286]QCD64759.1 isochorismate synthase [Halomicrobium mukohataei]QFR19566.1 isochorismate synthase [Halomicrobium sp. ZPS1]